MHYVMRLIRVLIALLTFAAAGAAAAEPYSVEDAVEDAIHRQAVGVRFTPDGHDVLMEEDVGWGSDNRTSSSKFLWFDLREGGNGQALLSGAQDEAYSYLSPSPDSRYVAYLHRHGGSANVGVYDFRNRRNIEFDTARATEPYWAWISDHEVVFLQVSPRAPRPAFPAQMPLEWRKMQEGASTTASAMGSGRYAASPENNVDEGIAVADVKTGAIRLIGHGRFLDQAVSPDGARMVAIRQLPAIVNPRLPIWSAQGRGPLVVFDINRDRVPRQTGPLPDALSGSLRWSPSGKHLAFLVAQDNGSGSEVQFWTYDAVNGGARRVDLTGLSVSPSGERPPRAFAWLGEDLVVLARTRVPTVPQTQNAVAPAHAARADWFLLRPGVDPINLTAQFGQTPELAAIAKQSLLMSADGQVWEVRANRQRRLLAGESGKRVRVVSDPALVPELINASTEASTAAATPSLVLEDESAQGPKTVYFLDVASGHIAGHVTAPAEDAKIMAISTALKRVAFQYHQDNADIIAVADPGDIHREILRFNESRKDRQIGTFVEIDHKSDTGRKLISWLLLPPGYRKGPPLPTVVVIYPGATYNSGPPGLPSVTPGNRLLAAHGYAVLFASLPIDESVLPREPLQGLADAVLSVVDAAKAQGYVDGDRLAIQGHSFGGYGTLGVIGQTDRFKAAVAESGVYDLLSFYGEPEIFDRLTGEFDGIVYPQRPMGWSETGQGGLGVPPWRDPQRYLRNSPLLHVDTVHTPVMLVHGDLDAVAFTQSEEMFTALYRLNKDAVFVRYWGETHAVPASPANIRDYWNRVYAWYDSHIGPPFDVAKALSICTADCH